MRQTQKSATFGKLNDMTLHDIIHRQSNFLSEKRIVCSAHQKNNKRPKSNFMPDYFFFFAECSIGIGHIDKLFMIHWNTNFSSEWWIRIYNYCPLNIRRGSKSSRPGAGGGVLTVDKRKRGCLVSFLHRIYWHLIAIWWAFQTITDINMSLCGVFFFIF